MNNGPGTYAWKLKHSLILKMVREKGDFKLDLINEEVAKATHNETAVNEKTFYKRGSAHTDRNCPVSKA